MDESSVFKEESGEEFSQRYDPSKILHGIQRHLGILGLSILIWSGLGAVATWYYSHHYLAEAVVIYQEDLPKTLPGGIVLNNLSMATSMDLITLPTNFQAVKAILGLSITPKAIEDMVSVPPPRLNSNLIRITTKADNPSLAVDISNSLAKIAVKNSQDFSQRQLQVELENFRNQLGKSALKLASQQKEIQEFKTAHQYFEMTADYATLLTQLAKLRQELQTADLHYNSLLVEYENMKSSEKMLASNFDTQNSYNDPLQVRINALEANLAEARARYAPSNPKLQVIQDELNSLLDKAKLQSDTGERVSPELIRMEGKVRGAQKMKQDLTVAVEKLEKQLESLPAEQISFSQLLQASKLTEEDVEFLSKSIDTIQLMINVPKGSLEMNHLAEKAKPLSERWFVQLFPLLGLLFGTLFGLGLAALIEMRDTKLCTPKQVDLAYNVPLFIQIPEFGRLTETNASDKLLYFVRSLAERIDRQIQALFPKKQNVVLTFTSSTVDEGKSTLAKQLALYYQRIGKRVLLLEMDPKPISGAESSSATSLEALFQKGNDWQQLVIQGKPDRIRAWSSDPYMKEVIKSSAMAQFLEKLKGAYEIIIIDAPGVIDEHYAANLASMADITVFVISSKDTDKALVDESLRELTQMGVKPNGFALNRVMPIFIDDTKIKQEMGRINREFWRSLQFWRKT